MYVFQISRLCFNLSTIFQRTHALGLRKFKKTYMCSIKCWQVIFLVQIVWVTEVQEWSRVSDVKLINSLPNVCERLQNNNCADTFVTLWNWKWFNLN